MLQHHSLHRILFYYELHQVYTEDWNIFLKFSVSVWVSSCGDWWDTSLELVSISTKPNYLTTNICYHEGSFKFFLKKLMEFPKKDFDKCQPQSHLFSHPSMQSFKKFFIDNSKPSQRHNIQTYSWTFCWFDTRVEKCWSQILLQNIKLYFTQYR